MPYKNAYDEFVDFEIDGIVWEEDYVRLITANPPEELSPEVQNRLRALNAEDIVEENQQDIQQAQEKFDELKTSIEFDYAAPAISVDTSGRFVNQEIVGGSTVRQKIGEEPIEVVVNGVVKEPNARRLDNLRDAKYGDIYSSRLPGGSLRVQFASTSTSPLKDSGAVQIADEEFLYSFTLSCVEVNV